MSALRGFFYGFGFILILAFAMEAAHAQTTFNDEDTLTALILGIGAVLFAFGFMSGKQR